VKVREAVRRFVALGPLVGEREAVRGGDDRPRALQVSAEFKPPPPTTAVCMTRRLGA
jgi:hypothetical protein